MYEKFRRDLDRYCPLVTPFKAETEQVDYEAWTTHVLNIAKTGMGLVVYGTNGEGIYKNHVKPNTQVMMMI